MMLKPIFTLFWCSIYLPVFAQKEAVYTPHQDTAVFACGGEVPTPPFVLKKYIEEHLNYPQEAIKADIQGRVYISVVIQEDGKVTDAKVVKGQELGYGLPEEALRVIQSMPGKWKPAISLQTNKPAKCHYTIPVVFILQ
ncbi:hypothetical protein DBR32_10180 [Taibaiella sp. KBW10]|uniref:energy transducer TonB n=1 Tax=Taibaiella sp. KBW10 TaxID=2153357 RepID=UPI000F5B2D4A|nr:energy transducer TonB [Taibaiella sp. KBW10]RQO31063.1 hypothetical protein DBR32_10180 [Taibaiella sp. KBW10]